MTAEPDLLPLPEPVAVKYPDSGLRDDEHALRLWAAHGYDTGGEPLFSAEQLREATAPLQAEIEALRAEVNRFRALEAEAAEFVEVPIINRTKFTGDEPYVGWRGLGQSLNEALDERDALRAEVEMLRDAFSDEDMTAGAHWFGRYVEQKRSAERLAEALRPHIEDLERSAVVLDQYPAMAPTAAEMRKAAAELRAALEQEAGRG